MGSSEILGGYLPHLLALTVAHALIVWVSTAILTDGEGEDITAEFADIGAGGFDIGQMFDAIGALFGLIFLPPDFYPFILKAFHVLLIQIPWFIAIVQLIISLIPFT